MKDEALRASMQITAQAYLTRGDHDGYLIHKVLTAILAGAHTLDCAMGQKRRSTKLPSTDRAAP